MKKRHFSRTALVLSFAFAILILPACRREEPSAVPEVPAGFATAPPRLTAVFKQPTTIITPVTTATPVPEQTAEMDRGKRLYESKGCADCHGAQGEGVDGKGHGLAGTQLTEQQFEGILRTGGAGKLGSEHLYGPQTISPSGISAMYAYVKSFSAR